MVHLQIDTGEELTGETRNYSVVYGKADYIFFKNKSIRENKNIILIAFSVSHWDVKIKR